MKNAAPRAECKMMHDATDKCGEDEISCDLLVLQCAHQDIVLNDSVHRRHQPAKLESSCDLTLVAIPISNPDPASCASRSAPW